MLPSEGSSGRCGWERWIFRPWRGRCRGGEPHTPSGPAGPRTRKARVTSPWEHRGVTGTPAFSVASLPPCVRSQLPSPCAELPPLPYFHSVGLALGVCSGGSARGLTCWSPAWPGAPVGGSRGVLVAVPARGSAASKTRGVRRRPPRGRGDRQAAVPLTGVEQWAAGRRDCWWARCGGAGVLPECGKGRGAAVSRASFLSCPL